MAKAAHAAIFLAAALAAVALCADADAGADDTVFKGPWVGGDQDKLAADKAECRKEAAEIDVNQAAGYSDPRYGMISAMGAAIAEDNPLSSNRAQVKAAAFVACMNDKGWRQP
jgi:hypothetical protein